MTTIFRSILRNWYFRIVIAVIISVVMIMIGWLCNFAGYPMFNLFMAIMFYSATSIVGFYPDILLFVTGTGAAAGAAAGATVAPPVLVRGIVVTTETWTTLVRNVLMWISIIFMVLASFPFGTYLTVGEAFYATLFGLLCIAVITFIGKASWWKRIFTAYAWIGLAACLWMLIPSSLKIAVTGSDCSGFMYTSRNTQLITRARHIQENQIEEAEGAKIKGIVRRLQTGHGISIEEKNYLLEKEAELKKASLPTKIPGAVKWIEEKVSNIHLPKIPSMPTSAPAPQRQAQSKPVVQPKQVMTAQTASLPKEFMVDICWQQGSQSKAIKNLKMLLSSEAIQLNDGVASFKGSKNNAGQYVGTYNDDRTSSLGFTITSLDQNGNGRGFFAGNHPFQIIRR